MAITSGSIDRQPVSIYERTCAENRGLAGHLGMLATGRFVDGGTPGVQVWTFLVVNAQAIDPAQIAPMIDFIQAVRHERVAIETPDGIVMRDPPHPSFSIKGRTVQSTLRLMQDWHPS